jgi:Ala-tRNA(Pro) deacylase
LQLRGIPFAEYHHTDAYTAQEVAHREHFSGHHVAKVVVAMADGRPVELILPASRRVCLERVGQLLGARDIRLASEEEMALIFDDCETGAIPPLREWPGVEVLMDESLDVRGDILFQAGTHQDAIRVSFAEWFAMVRPCVLHFCEPLEPALV